MVQRIVQLNPSETVLAFQFTPGTRAMSIESGTMQTTEQSSGLIGFDRSGEFGYGTGNSVSRKLPNGQTATIGIDCEPRCRDLFPGNATESGATTDSEPRPLNVPEPPIEV